MLAQPEPQPPAEVHASLPRRLGGYEILHTIGSGGMAEVLLARQHGPAGFEKLVVLKCIHRHLATKKRFIDMFLDEARLAARINDPHVVQIYELGESNGTYFMAMEYLVGESMSTIIRASTLSGGTLMPPHLVARVVADAAAGLHAAHELSDRDGSPLEVVHRDVSHSNLVVLYSGQVKVVDFGVAKARSSLVKTEPDQLKGKFGYMSPEQIDGQPVDRRSDIFSLGIVLWEALTRKRLFSSDTQAATLKRIVEGIAPPPSSLRDEIAPELDEIAVKALAKRPEDRFQTAEEMRAALERFIRRANLAAGAMELSSFMKSAFPERNELRARLLDEARNDGELPLTQLQELQSDPRSPITSPTIELEMMRTSNRRLRWLTAGLAATVLTAAAYRLGSHRDEIKPPPVVVVAPPPTPDAPSEDQNLVGKLLDQAELAIRDGRIAEPPGDNALELILDVEKRDPANPRTKEMRTQAISALLASAQTLWDHHKLDSARAIYADVLLFDPANAIAQERIKARDAAPRPATRPANSTADDARIGWLIAQIELAIIERRFVAPAGHNALDLLLELRRIDPTNEATRRMGEQIATALQQEARATPADAKTLLAAADVALGDKRASTDGGGSGSSGAGSGAIVEKPQDSAAARVWITKGNDLLAAAKLSEARVAFERAIQADNRAAAALDGLAEVAYNEGDYTRAVLAAKRAIAIAPRSSGYRMTLAKSYYKLLRYDDAIAQWQKVLELEPTNTAAKKNLEMAQAKLGK